MEIFKVKIETLIWCTFSFSNKHIYNYYCKLFADGHNRIVFMCIIYILVNMSELYINCLKIFFLVSNTVDTICLFYLSKSLYYLNIYISFIIFFFLINKTELKIGKAVIEAFWDFTVFLYKLTVSCFSKNIFRNWLNFVLKATEYTCYS